MFLRRITVTGFKSFANKTVLDLERGITAVVGPNGSGKSNIADAIRWALGEQNKARLRMGDKEDVVFSGTDKRAKASFAEVVLLFDNSDGTFPLELTEVEISRRLYRSGETDYRLAGRSVRLGDIQQLLAEAGFGTNTYAVIGQGMIDNFLLSSPSERKLLFDEAAGIRGSEMRREASMRKLTATEANLTRLRDIHTELEPRLASLKRAAAAAEELKNIEADLGTVRGQIVGTALAEIESKRRELQVRSGALTTELGQINDERAALESAQEARLNEARQAEAARARHEQAVAGLEQEYAAQLEAAAALRGRHDQLLAGLERIGELRRREEAIAAELKAAQARADELKDELTANQAALDRAGRTLVRADQVVGKVQAQLVEIRQSSSDGTQQQYVQNALGILKTISLELRGKGLTAEQLQLMVHKAGRLLSHASKTGEAQIIGRVKDAQVRLEAAMTRRDTATEHQTNITISRRSLEIDAAHQQAHVDGIKQRQADLRADLDSLEARHNHSASLEQEALAAEAALAELKQQLSARRAELTGAHSSGAAELAEAATQLERLRSRQGATQLQLTATGQELEALTAEHQRYTGVAANWRIEPATATILSAASASVALSSAAQPAPAADLPALERAEARLATELATRRTLQQETAAELDEVNVRYGDLAIQIEDLEAAKSDLAKVVTELDQLIRVRFKDNFAALSEHFTKYFVRLFGGGVASLELEEGEDGEYGILIQASPKGKRVGNLSSLSGGERALAGVALLAAILSVNPSPFVVLDEIDAALDEANSGRLSGILDELSGRSQLVVITHNRQTMKAAKVLFGVTMNEHHVSHLLSLRLEEASAMAAR